MNLWTKNLLIFLLPLVVIIYAYVPGMRGDTWYADAGRHAMDGVFYLDVFSGQIDINAFPDSVWQYEAHYPAIKPNTYPPVFAVVEAIFFTVGGISFFVARLSVLSFLVMGAVFFYLIARRFHNVVLSITGTLLFLTCPVVVRWGREVMLEIPALAMILGTLYFYLRAFEKPVAGQPTKTHVKYLSLCLLFAVLIPYTKQTAGHVLPVLFLATVLNFGWKFIAKKTQLLGGLLGIAGLIPLLIVTIKYGSGLVGQVSGLLLAAPDPKPRGWELASLDAWFYYPIELVSMIGIPLLCLGVIGIFAGLKSKSRDWIKLHWTWLIFAYLIFTIMAYKNERHGIYLILPLLFLSLEALSFLITYKSWGKWIAYLLLAGAFVFQGWHIRFEQRYLAGSQEAVQYVRTKDFEGCLFIQGYSNANLIFQWRASGKCWDKPVLRSSRLFGKQRTMGIYGKKDFVNSREDIIKVIRKYRCQYVIVEDKDHLNQDAYKLFLKVLSNGEDFELEKKIPISIKKPLPGTIDKKNTYLIYRFKEKLTGKAKVLEYELWGGEKKKVPFHLE